MFWWGLSVVWCVLSLTWISGFVEHLVASDDGSDELIKATDSCGGILLSVIAL